MPQKAITTINLSKTVKSFSGEPIKDMLELKQGDDPSKAPTLTIGSLLGNGFLIGLKEIDKKQTLKVFNLAMEFQEAIEKNDGKYELDIDTLDQIEEFWSKIDHPTFKIPMHSGAVLQALHEARRDLLTKEKITE